MNIKFKAISSTIAWLKSWPGTRDLFIFIFLFFQLFVTHAQATQKNPITILAPNIPPVSFVKDGRITGLGIEIVREILNRLDRDDSIHMELWSEAFHRTQNEPNTVLLPPSRTPKREKLFQWVGPLIPEKLYLFGKKTGNSSNIKQLKTGAVKGYSSEQWLKDNSYNVVSFPSPKEGIEALMKGEIDLWINSNITMAHTAKKFGVDPEEIQAVQFVKDLPAYLAFSPSTDSTIVDEWQRVLNDMKQDGSYDRIVQVWVPLATTRSTSQTQELDVLSKKERAYLDSKGSITMCVDPNWLPFERINAINQHEGIAADFIKLMADRLKISIKLITTNSWSESTNKFAAKQCDILSAAAYSDKRARTMLFSHPYYETSAVIATRNEELFIQGIDSILDKPIGIVRDFYLIDRIRQLKKDVNIVETDSIQEGLELLRDGQIFAFLDTIPSISYAAQRAGINNIKIAGQLDFTNQFHITAHKGEEQLIAIFNKAINMLTREDRLTITSRWSNIKIDRQTDFTVVYNLIFVFVLLSLIFFHRHLKLSRLNRQLSKQQLLEKSLRDSEEKFKIFFQEAVTGLVMVSLDHQFIDVNPAFCKMVGYERDELLKMSFKNITHPSDLAEDLVYVKRLSKGSGTSFVKEKRYIKKSGEVLWGQLGATIVRDDYGAPQYLIAQILDIDDRKRALEKLQENEARLRGYFDLGLVGMATTSIEKGWIQVNNRLCEILGYEREELIQKTWSEITYPDDLAADVAKFNQVVAGEIEGYIIDKRFVRKDGQIVHATISASCFRNADGIIDFFVAFVNDITERKVAEEELQQTSKRLELAAQAGGIGVWELMLPGYELIWDKRIMEIYHVQPDEFSGNYEAWKSRVHRDDVEEAEQLLLNSLANKTEFETEFRIVWPDKSIHYIRAAALIERLDDGTPTKMIGVNWDVTDEKLSRAVLQEAKEQAEVANTAKSDFLATMSHEIRTPLNAIIGMADLLKDTELNNVQQRYVQTFNRSGETLLSIINDILDLSKIESGQLTLENITFDLKKIVNEAVELFALLALDKGISLNTYFQPGTSQWVIGDPTRMRQILLNLIGNAVKFTNTGSVDVNVYKGNDNLTSFLIADTGPGISKEHQEKIFQPFTQAGAFTTREHGGTGLGLTISRRLINLMGGTVDLKSELGRGTEFTFSVMLPLSTKSEILRKNTNSLSIDDNINRWLANLTILLAEDVEENQMVVQGFLQKSGCKLVIAENGAIALEKFKEMPFDMVLMDIQMPVMDGYAATKAIRAWEETQGAKRIPIIALTAHALHEEVAKTKAAGCDVHLSKPIHKDVLIDTICRFNFDETLLEQSNSEQNTDSHQLASNVIPKIADLPTINPEVLASLREDFGDVFAPTLSKFLDNLPERINAISDAASREDHEGLAKSAHTLKGTAATFGADRLSDISLQLEQTGKKGQLPSDNKLITAILAEGEVVKKEILKILAEE
ncbi:MAG: transporter substrate-binding domain-containing protein [Magnetococcales bacterium]|nr:transporter substrate-binding domain-containing protein [Magnetococcales bacterium]